MSESTVLKQVAQADKVYAPAGETVSSVLTDTSWQYGAMRTVL